MNILLTGLYGRILTSVYTYALGQDSPIQTCSVIKSYLLHNTPNELAGLLYF